MSNQPQCPLEEIELIPHPMDAWRAALNALIACAPGDGPAIAAHLAEARQLAMVFVDRTTATDGTRKLVDRLMLIGGGRIVGDRLQVQDAPATVAAILAAATRANGKCLITPAGAAARLLRSASGTASSVAQDAPVIHPGTGLESPARSAQPLSASPQSQAQPSQDSPVVAPASDPQAPVTGHSSTRPVDPASAEAPLLQPQPHGGFVPKPDSQ